MSPQDLIGAIALPVGVLLFLRWRFGPPHAGTRWLESIETNAPMPRYLANLPVVSVPAAVALLSLAPVWRSPVLLLASATIAGGLATFVAIWFGLAPPAWMQPGWRTADRSKSSASEPLTRFDLGLSLALGALGGVQLILAILLLQHH